MKDDWTKWLQERAYDLWEGEGKKEGKSEHYWLAAEAQRPNAQTSPAPPNSDEDVAIVEHSTDSDRDLGDDSDTDTYLHNLGP